LDVQKAIVKAKKLDQGGQLDFDLSIRDASTNEEYVDESMVLGFLACMARANAGMTGAIATSSAGNTAAPSGFYTIDSRAHDDKEFVSTAAPTAAAGGGEEEKELAALLAVTDPGTSGATTGGFHSVLMTRVARSGPPPPSRGTSHFCAASSRPQCPNADPELRQQERMPKKRATGIPITLHNLSDQP